MKKIVLLLCLMATCNLFSQEKNCGTMENLEIRKQQDPTLEARMKQIEVFTQNKVAQMQNSRVQGDVITIPVVVHVLYRNSTENISVAQIQSQLDVLNEDFRRTNSDADNRWSQAADTQIEFCLSTVNPNGGVTTGITRKQTTRQDWGANDDAKRASSGGIDPWNTSEYLNMWIVPKMTTVSGGRTINLLGYAQFPGGAAATDGLVMIYNAFGRVGAVSAPYDGGRTTTHEIGHFLNLRHIWGDANCGNDFVSDTPTHQTSNSGCPTGQVSCSSTDMPQNYMDYTNDSCMNLFTLGQKNRMRSVLDAGGSRRSLALSDKCGAVVVAPTCSDGIKNGNETGVDCGGSSCEPCQTACTDKEVTINITFDNYPEETSWSLVNDSGATIATGAYSKSNADGSTVSETLCLPDDCYTFTIKDAYGDGMCCSYGNGSYTITGPDGSIKTGGTFGASEATDFCFIPAPTCTDGIKNGDETEIDCGGSSCEPCQVTCIDTALTIKFDNYPEETSWNLKDNSGAIVASGGTYASQADGSTLVINNCLPLGCYTLEFKDTYGDGMCCSYGNGSYAITNSSTGAVLASGASYTSTDTNTFCASNTREETVKTFETPLSIKIYPNPVTRNELNVVTKNGEKSTYKIISTLGQVLLYGELNDVRSTINVSNLNTGVYFIVVKNDITNTTKQFIKK